MKLTGSQRKEIAIDVLKELKEDWNKVIEIENSEDEIEIINNDLIIIQKTSNLLDEYGSGLKDIEITEEI